LRSSNGSWLPSADREPNQKLLQSFVRAHAWLSDLADNRFSSIEELASKADIHPKVMRQALKLAFLAPNIVTPILAGEATFGLADLRNVSALSWQSQHKELHQATTDRNGSASLKRRVAVPWSGRLAGHQ
jgi:site-specific DNA recombinase